MDNNKTRIIIHATSDHPEIRVTDGQYTLMYVLYGFYFDDDYEPDPNFTWFCESLCADNRKPDDDNSAPIWSRAQVRTALKALVRKGLIQITSKPGKRYRYLFTELGYSLFHGDEPSMTYIFLDNIHATSVGPILENGKRAVCEVNGVPQARVPRREERTA